MEDGVRARRVVRNGVVIYAGKLSSLRRFKDDVREVVSPLECGIGIENFNDVKVGDRIEAYEIEATPDTL
jgi:translation initiation factor IF-2